MQIDDIYQLIASDRQAVDTVIQQQLHSNVVLINQIGTYIINNGGKRLRPMLILLVAGAFAHKGTHHHTLAAVIEFIHTATLLHDDVVDASQLRRGHDTANTVWGNEAAVLVGDFLYSRAFEMMVSVGDMRVMEILSHTTNTIAEGEVQQLLNIHNADLDEQGYLHVIQSKTAKLFEASAELGAVLCNRNSSEQQAMASYGNHIGVAFQLIDDALDYTANAAELGKQPGDDLAEGKPTLPLLHVLQHGTTEQQQLVRHAIEHGGREHIDAILSAITECDAIRYTVDKAREHASLAISALACIPSDNRYRQALEKLAHFAVDRTF